MPTTKNIRLIKITASSRLARGVLGTVVILSVAVGFYFLNCKIGFLPGNMCGNNNLESNTPPLTPEPTDEPMDISAQPVPLPICDNTQITKPPFCGAWYGVDGSSYCGADGTSFRTFTYRVSGSVAEHYKEISEGTLVESNPPGLCYWKSITPTDIDGYDGYYDVTLTCAGPSGAFIKITDSFGPESCEVSTDPCPDGYEIETSNLENDHMFYCTPKGQINKSASCGSEMFVDEQNSCCSPKPANSIPFVCLDYETTQNGFSCKPDYQNDEMLKTGFTLPTCSSPERPRPSDEGDESKPAKPTCTPDATGGGCP